MKDVFSNCKHVSMGSARKLVLLDTCFFINFLEHHASMDSIGENVPFATTSFNIEELEHVSHRLSHELKHRLREFFRSKELLIVDVPVSPGDWAKEKSFVNSVDDKLLANVPDPSDAVLIAAAMKTGSCVVTRDKHHLFTCKLEHFLGKYGIAVYKDLKFLE